VGACLLSKCVTRQSEAGVHFKVSTPPPTHPSSPITKPPCNLRPQTDGKAGTVLLLSP